VIGLLLCRAEVWGGQFSLQASMNIWTREEAQT
jgi:hypothetical protein